MKNLFQFGDVTFAHPLFFLLLLFIPLAIVWSLFFKKNNTSSLYISTTKNLTSIQPSLRIRLRPLLHILRGLAFTFLVIALARPQKSSTNENIDSDGIDIMLSMDISGSMLAQDFTPNRIEAAKKVAEEFIVSRITDKIGLVIFSGESFTQCPLTTDKNVLLAQLQNIQSGMLEDGTAIGMGLSTAVDRLRSSKAKSKIIILLTDGVNNGGLVDPVTALEIAKAFAIKVYTIGVGTEGMADYPTQDAFGNTVMQKQPVLIDEDLMKKISTETGGKYYRATDNNSLTNIYKDIDKLEKSNVEISSYTQYKECFHSFALIGLVLLLLELVLNFTYFSKI
jgi:Ca-activated chloride channel family protein